MTDDKLQDYKRKRDFTKTSEPSESIASKSGQLFVIQKHAASRLHYDFRLEIDGVLKSWAVPKGPSTDPRDKRLAVETEDHPISYAQFEGTIPEDEYGGGTVMVWDIGTYKNIKRKGGAEIDMGTCYENGQIEIELEGKKLHGGYALRRFKVERGKAQWLLIKMKDDHADPDHDPTEKAPDSALTGRTMDQIAAESDQ